MRKIILLGYMGCGKSTIANRLSKITAIPYLDLDKCIEERTHLSINEIFNQHGEIYFRKLEREVFIDLLNSPGDLIIGLGGGTPCYANNHELLTGENIESIYLKASVDTLFDRSFYYNQAQYKLVIDGKTKDETTQDILALLA